MLGNESRGATPVGFGGANPNPNPNPHGDGLVRHDGRHEATRERPLSITFAHCWQRQTDGGRPYYSNSATGESVWERPPVLEAVLAAMQERQ